MKTKLLICLLLVLVLSLVAGAASAKGSKNGVYIKFGSPGNWVDSWWLKTRSGLVHEWKVMPDGDRQHLVFKPAAKFPVPDCDDDAFNVLPNWLAHNYNHHSSSEGYMGDFLDFGEYYRVCFYPW